MAKFEDIKEDIKDGKDTKNAIQRAEAYMKDIEAQDEELYLELLLYALEHYKPMLIDVDYKDKIKAK